MKTYSDKFGKRFKEVRRQKEWTLRGFCREHGFDHGNLSRIERGLAKPPTGERLRKYLSALGIQEESDLWYELYDLANACAGEIPPEIMEEEELVEKLPVVFRSVGREKPKEEDIETLIDLVQDEMKGK